MKSIFAALITTLVGALCAVLLAPPAEAQTYPTRTVTLLVASSTGSSMDIVARLLGPILSQRLGQAVVVVPDEVGLDGCAGAGEWWPWRDSAGVL